MPNLPVWSLSKPTLWVGLCIILWTHWFFWSCLSAVCPAKSGGSMSHWFQQLIRLRVLSTTQAHFDWYEAPEHLAAFLYVSLGMGSASHNQPATVSGLGYLAPLKFQEWLLRIFEYLHSPNGLILLMYIYLQCSTINLCFEAWCKCSGQ